MTYWLMKSEPTTYSINDLQQVGTDSWDGVRNYQARNMIRDDMQPEDLAFFYHSNCKIPAIVGIMKIITAAYPDDTAYNPDSKYYDPKSSPQNPRWYQIDVEFIEKWGQPISLHTLKQYSQLADIPLLKRGNRLSIMPISPQAWQFIHSLR